MGILQEQLALGHGVKHTPSLALDKAEEGSRGSEAVTEQQDESAGK